MGRMYNYIGTIKEYLKSMHKIGGCLYGSFKKRLELFRARIGDWQEAYMERLVKEYVDLLEGEEKASDKFWNLEERIKKDKKHPGVMLELSKGNMMFDIVALINGGVITTADLEGFSDELKESVNFLLHR